MIGHDTPSFRESITNKWTIVDIPMGLISLHNLMIMSEVLHL